MPMDIFWIEFWSMVALLLNGVAFLGACVYVGYVLFPDEDD